VNGCVADTSAIISHPDSLQIQITSIKNVSCTTGSDGAVSISGMGGTTPYSYNWSDGSTASDRTNLTAGKYPVTISDKNLCSTLDTIEITEPLVGLSALIDSQSDALCKDSTSGTAIITGSGGVKPYSYIWPDGLADSSRTDLAKGTYEVTVTDNNNCQNTVSLTIDEPLTSILASISITNHVSCFGLTDGSAQISASGGTSTGTYLYAWPDGTSTNGHNALASGDYIVTATDNNGCQDTAIVSITEPSKIDIAFDTDSTSCSNSTDGRSRSIVSGGTKPYIYNWSNGISDTLIENVDAGIYTLDIQDNNGCIATKNDTIFAPDTLKLSIASIANATCNGGSNGSININISGGSSPYTFGWNSGETTQNITSAPAGNYTLSVTDSHNCIDSIKATIAEPALLSISITDSSRISCNGLSDGTATITPAGGTKPYKYTWSNGSTDSTATGLFPGTHYVTVADANNCSAVDSVKITEPNLLTGVISIDTTVSCFGAKDATIHISASGGTEPYTYQWKSLGTDSLESNLSSGKYIVTVTDNNLCVYEDSISVTDPAPLTIKNIKSTPTACAAATGTAKVSVSGGTQPYTYIWSNTATTDSISNLIVDLYSVTVSDTNNCTIDTIVEVIDTSTFDITIIAPDTSVYCKGANSGSAVVLTKGGTEPFTYIWSDGSSNDTINNLFAGKYTVSVSDKNSCSRVANVIISEDSILTMAFDSIHQISCNSSADGAIIVKAHNGIEPYAYNWSNNETNDSLLGLSPGKYIITLTDGAKCTIIDSVEIIEPAALAGSFTGVSNISCAGTCNGTASFTTSTNAGTPPYRYLWENGSSDSTAINLCSGYHTITVIDFNNCQYIDSVEIYDNASPILFSYDSTLSTCGKADGELVARINGGTKPYTYSWNNGITDSTNKNIATGVYQLTVTDANGCSDSNYVVLNDTSDIVITGFTSATSSCYPCLNTLEVSATGGTEPYSYNWSNFDTRSIADSLCQGIHTVTITDINGCQASGFDSITLDNSFAVLLAETKSISCGGFADAEVSASVSGGISPYKYKWSNGDTAETATKLSVGKVYVTISDMASCSIIDSIIITEPSNIAINISEDSAITCFGDSSAYATAHVSGGTKPFIYNWSTGSTDSITSKLYAGWHYITIQDAGGCFASDSIQIQEPLAITIDSLSMVPSACNAPNGSVILYVSGGTATKDYQYSWSTGETNDTLKNILAGDYTVSIKDDNNCEINRIVSVTDSSDMSLALNADADAIRCSGQNNGIAEVTVSGGTAPIKVLWSTGDTVAKIDSLFAGDYSVTVTDSNTCTRTSTITLVEDSVLSITNIELSHIACSGTNDGTISVSVQGGFSPYSYNWSNGDTVASISDLSTGMYYVTISDTVNCSIVDSAEIFAPSSLAGTFSDTNNIVCSGTCTGSTAYSVTGGTEPYAIQWSNMDTDSIADSLCAGYVYVTVTDSNFCTLVDSIEILELHPPLAIDSILTTVAHCGLSDAEASIYISGGKTPYSYSWNTGDTNDTIQNLSVGIYFATVQDSNLCAIDTFAIVNDTSDIAIAEIIKTEPHCDPCDATATIKGIGGTGNYTYQWSNGNTDSIATNLCAGMFTATITDNNLCRSAIIDTIFDNSLFDLKLLVSEISCANANDGAIEAITSGGTGSYTYLWSTGDTTSIIDSLMQGTYYVTVSDTICTIIDSITLVNPDSLIVETKTIDALCYGDNNGVMEIASINGVIPDTYSWPTSGADQSAINSTLYAGIYTVTITYNKHCFLEVTDTVGQPDQIVASLSMTPSYCGQDNGSASISVSGGITPYIYHWYNYGMEDSTIVDATNDTITNLPVDFYWASVTDSNNCVLKTDYIYVSDTNNFSLSITDRHEISCSDRTDGSITIEGNSSATPLDYVWYKFNNGILTDSIVNPSASNLDSLDSGEYKVYATDTNNCTAAQLFEFNYDYILRINNFEINNTSCKGESNGSAKVVAIYGTPRNQTPYYDYLWSKDSIKIDSIIDLVAGIYYVTVTDTTNCSIEDSVVIKDPKPINIIFPSDTVFTHCYSDTVDSIAITIRNNTTPVDILWSDGSTDTVAYGLGIGWHYVSVNDTLGCSNTDSVFVMKEHDYYITFDTVSTVCGDSLGIATAYPIGGIEPYSYNWSTGSSDTAIFDLGVALYYVTVTDANNCIVSDTVKIEDTSSVSFNFIVNKQVSCKGLAIGEAEIVDIKNTTDPVSYLWQNGDTRKIADSLREGLLEARIIDANSCIALNQLTMTSDFVLSIDGFERTNDVSCNGISNGSLKGIVSGGKEPFKYLWNTADTDTTIKITGLSPNTYRLTVTDSNNCVVVDSMEIEADPLRIVVDSVTDIECFGYATGAIDITVLGGFGKKLAYAWNTGDSIPDLDSLTAGKYSITVTESGVDGCNVADTITVSQPYGFRTSYTQKEFPDCVDSTGVVVLSISGGNAPFSYEWSNGQTDSVLDNVKRDFYYLTITDSKNCSIIDTVEVKDNSPMSTSMVTNSIKCYDSYGSLEVIAKNGVEPYTYTWNTLDTVRKILGLDEGHYSVTVTDNDNCWRTEENTLIRPDSMIVTISGDTLIECYGDSSWVAGHAEGGTPGLSGYTYSWYIGQTKLDYNTDSLKRVPAGTYTLAVRDEEGCPAEQVSFYLKQAAQLTAESALTRTGCETKSATGRIEITSVNGWFNPTFVWTDTHTNETVRDNLVDDRYSIEISDTMNCLRNISFDVSPLLIMSIIDTNSVFAKCERNSYDGTIEIEQVFGGVSPYTYLWDNGETTSVADQLSAGVHSVTITGANECSEVFHDTVDFYIRIPSFKIKTADNNIYNQTKICIGDSVQLTAEGTDPWAINYVFQERYPKYYWFAEDNINEKTIRSADEAPTWIVPDSTSRYYAYRSQDGCFSDTATFLVIHRDTLGVNLTLNMDGNELDYGEEIIAGEEVEIRPDDPWYLLELDEDGFVSYKWNSYKPDFSADGRVVDSIINSETYDASGEYALFINPEETSYYIVEAETRYGCFEYDTMLVNVIPDVFIPSGISPNGDGVNDVWNIPYLKFAPEAHILIFNRWGAKVFEADKNYYLNPWDGTNKKGKDLAIGTYYYKIEFNDAKNTAPRSGSITIIR